MKKITKTDLEKVQNMKDKEQAEKKVIDLMLTIAKAIHIRSSNLYVLTATQNEVFLKELKGHGKIAKKKFTGREIKVYKYGQKIEHLDLPAHYGLSNWNRYKYIKTEYGTYIVFMSTKQEKIHN